MKLYLDASAIIYGVDSLPPLRDRVLARITQVEASPGGMIMTSRLSMLECRVKPLRDGNTKLVAIYDELFARASLHLIDISATIIERATQLRVRYGLKTPDAIHAASAIEERADVLLTGDGDFTRCKELIVEVI